MKKILIKCYTNVNLGDDLFVKILCERYPENEFQIVCDHEDAVSFQDIKNLQIVNSKDQFKILNNFSKLSSIKSHLINNFLAKKNDVTVHIGGSIFIQPEGNWKIKVRKYQSLISSSRKFYIIGCNFGPYEDPSFELEYRKIFSQVNDVSFRDMKSYQLFSDIESVRYAPDVVFGLDSSQIKNISNEPHIIISVLNLSHRADLKEYKEQYEKFIIDISQKLLLKGFKVTLMSFCADEGDEEVVERLISIINDKRIQSYLYRGDMNKALEIIKSSKGVVATRFHSLILAWIFNKPVFPIIYSKKTLNVIRDVGFSDYYSDIKDLFKLDLTKVVDQLTNSNSFHLNSQIKESVNHFKQLDKILDNNKL